MQPCEYCVYIRFDMFIISFATLLLAVSYKHCSIQIIGFAFVFWGICLGMHHSLKLDFLYQALHDTNPFGLKGCSFHPRFPFALPLDSLFPSLFKPSGLCGVDSPIIPQSHLGLTALQHFFIGDYSHNFQNGFYSNGWYLLPQFRFINMPTACFIIFVAFLSCVIYLFIKTLVTHAQQRMSLLLLTPIIFSAIIFLDVYIF